MGQNLILNMDSKGFVVCAYNRTVDKVSLQSGYTLSYRQQSSNLIKFLRDVTKLLATFARTCVSSINITLVNVLRFDVVIRLLNS